MRARHSAPAAIWNAAPAGAKGGQKVMSLLPPPVRPLPANSRKAGEALLSQPSPVERMTYIFYWMIPFVSTVHTVSLESL